MALIESSIFEFMFFILLISFTIKYIKSWKRCLIKSTGIHGIPLLGSILHFSESFLNVLVSGIQLLTNKNPEAYGPAIGIYLKDPRDFEIVLNSQLTLGKAMNVYHLVVPFVGTGLVIANVQLWKKHRKIMAPAFSQRNTAGYFDIFCKNAKSLVDGVRKEEGKGLFDIYHYISNANLMSICETSLGLDISTDKKFSNIISIVDRVLDLLSERIHTVWHFFDWSFKLFPKKREFDKVVAVYQTAMSSILDESKKQYYSNKSTERHNVERTTKYLLEDALALTEEGTGYTHQQLQDEANTIVFAGYETSASTLSFALMMLGIYPDIQERVYQEIINEIGNHECIDYNALKNLQYMERVIKETLRHFPVVPTIARIAEGDIKLTNGTAPAGATLVLGIFESHKNPEIWPNPMKFDPDRFLPDEVSKRHPYSWIPFSAGSRNCIGIRYAWVGMKIILASILKDYQIKTCYKSVEDIPLQMSIIVRPTQGYLIEIVRRKNSLPTN